jgi:hypothetical protein
MEELRDELSGAAGPGAAGAAEPILPLEQVRPGMACTVQSVVRGTEISRFDAEVLDVVDGSVTGLGPKLLVRVSGPAVDRTGLGPGFSGSPVSCAGADGVERIAGAISHGVGDATNRMALAAPIERVLGRPPGARARVAGARLPLRDVRPLTALSLSGAGGWLAAAADRGAQRAGQRVLAVPGRPAAGFAPVDLRPGSAMAVGLASGDLALSAIGTVSFRDGARLWGFGHQLDGAGRRSLLLQDAYVYGIVDNPGFAGGSFKLAAPGHTLGTMTHDRPDAVGGTLGVAPRTVPVEVVARDADHGTTTSTRLAVADESALDEPAGTSALRVAATLAVAERAVGALDGAPARQTATMCAQIALRAIRVPFGFCNRYVIDGVPAAGAGQRELHDHPVVPPLAERAAADLDEALALLDTNTFARLRPASVTVTLSVRRGLRQAFLVDARGPRHARPGHVLRVRARVRSFRGATRALTLRVPVPRTARPGRYELALTGTPADTAQQAMGLEEVFAAGFGAGGPGVPASEGPASLPELAARVAMIERPDGVSAAFVPARRRSERPDMGGEPVHLSARERISGATSITLRITRR